jgi:hypothetical protein
MFIWRLVLVVVLMTAKGSIVFGQPLFRHEHEWTFELDNRKYGIDRLIQEPGHWQHTQIWLGGGAFAPETNYEDRIVFLLPGVKVLYGVHTVSRFLVESYFAREWATAVSPDRLILLSQRLTLPYLRGSPHIFDYPRSRR